MEALARSSKKSQGYSLIEVLVSLLLMTIVLLALMESVVLYTQTNMRNMLRDEAVRLTQDTLYNLRSRGFNNVPSASSPGITSTTQVVRNLRSTHWRFDVTVTVTDVDPQMKSAVAVTTCCFNPTAGNVAPFLRTAFTHKASTLIPDLK